MNIFSRKLPRALVVIVFAALFLRLTLFALLLNTFGETGMFLSDSYRFTSIAENMIAGNGFSRYVPELDAIRPTAVFPPIYPLLLVLSQTATGSYIPLIILQLILGSLMPLLVYAIGRFLTKKQGVLLGASALTAFEPLMIVWNLVLLTETVSLFLLLLSVLFFLRFLGGSRASASLPPLDTEKIAYGAAAAFFLGVSSLVRPNAQYLIILFAAYGIIVTMRFSIHRQWKKMYRIARAVGIVTALFIITLGPWMVRNYVTFGSYSISTTGPRNVYSNFQASMLVLKENTTFDEANFRLMENFAKRHGILVHDIYNDPRYSKTLLWEGIRFVLSDMKYAIPTFAIITTSFFTHDAYLDYSSRYGIIEPLTLLEFSPSASLVTNGIKDTVITIWNRVGPLFFVALGARIFWAGILLSAVTGSIILIRSQNPMVRRSACVLVAVIIYYWLTTMAVGFGTMARMRYPANPFLFILSGVGFAATITYLRTKALFWKK